MDMFGTASGNLYLDDGESLAYQSGAFEYLTFNLENNHLTVEGNESSYQSGKLVNEVMIAGYGLGPLAVTQAGHDVEWSFDDFKGILSVTLPGVPVRDLDLSVVMRC